MKLQEIQLRWITKFYEMRDRQCFPRIDGTRLAAPFLSVSGEPEVSRRLNPILLIGKATAGPWNLDEFLSNTKRTHHEQIEERIICTQQFLKSKKQDQHSAFWRFWKNLHTIGSPVIWTNLVKIGVNKGNPAGAYRSAQVDLARETLKVEIAEYKPKLVILVSGDYAGDEIVCPAFETAKGEWNEPSDGEFWWLDRTDSRPSVLWTNHPQGKSREDIHRWLEKAQELIAQPQ